MPVLKPEDLVMMHPDYVDLEEDRRLCRDLMGGTRVMREAREAYLPQEAAEEQEDYDVRLERTFLYNAFRRTVYNLTGRVFDKPVTVNGHDQYEDWTKHATNDGRDLTVFSRDCFVTGLTQGITFLLVDYPVAPEAENRADEKALALRPYLCEIKPENMIYWNHDIVNSQPVLDEVRFFEYYIEDCKRCKQIKVIWLEGEVVNWQIWREKSKEEVVDGESQHYVYGEGVMTPLTEIPVIPVYVGEQVGPFCASPPLRDLAEMNLAHWQSSSDQRHILHVARVPVLFTKGLNAGSNEKIVIGVNRHLRADNPNADAKYIEHTGQAIGSGRQDLEDLKQQMAAMGVELLLPNRPGDLTATGKAINKAAEESTLQIMARCLQDALNAAFYFMGQWRGIDAEPEVDMNTSFDLILSEPSELDSVKWMSETGNLSRTTLWFEMQRRGILSEDFDPEKEEALIATEAPSGLGGIFEPTYEGDEGEPAKEVIEPYEPAPPDEAKEPAEGEEQNESA